MLWLFIDVQAEDVRSGVVSDNIEVEFPCGRCRPCPGTRSGCAPLVQEAPGGGVGMGRRCGGRDATMSKTFVVLSSADLQRDSAKGTREQPLWDEHARFIEGIIDGFIIMGGPFEDEGGSMLIVRAEHEAEVSEKLKPDPWYIHGILHLQSIRQWDIFIDERG